jgi:tetratricopeptide (TPR) repeat protein
LGQDVSIIVGYDPITLREKVNMAAAAERLDEIGEQRSTAALNEKVGLLRLLGRLDEAWDMANTALRQARFSGDREELCLARIRRAQVQHYLGKLEGALVELTSCVEEARAHDWAAAEALALHERGKLYFDQQELKLALLDFRGAVTIRVRIGASADDVDSSMMAIAITESYLEV